MIRLIYPVILLIAAILSGIVAAVVWFFSVPTDPKRDYTGDNLIGLAAFLFLILLFTFIVPHWTC